MNKIAIIGCSGSGKSTLASKLGAKYDIKPIDLDVIRFTDGFVSEKRPPEDFMKDVASIASESQWIAEGIYYQYGIEKVLWKKADAVIWLDMPLWLIQIRTWRRSIKRLIKKQTKPSGSPVSWTTEFGKNGLLRGLHKIHKATRNYYPDLLKSVDSDTEVIRIKSSSELKDFIKSIQG